jgi:hypothetical protein
MRAALCASERKALVARPVVYEGQKTAAVFTTMFLETMRGGLGHTGYLRMTVGTSVATKP